MTPEKWKKIKASLSAVIDLPAGERAAFLDRETDSAVRHDVEKLFAAYKSSDGFIEKPLLIEQGMADGDDRNDLIGNHVENYLILKRIGSGGMGAVYLAERVNSDFKQKVALKLIKRGMDSEAIIKRFAIERRILSTLNHPNIAQLLDGGISSEGLPFFVMEFVDGKPLNQFCLENHVPLGKRLQIFRQICSAVEHAHKNLVIHRDLKPSNVLVTEDGTPKLLDFGIAKLLSDDGFETANTATQGKMFTPEYASPEQILGKTVTTATDVYSLGVILYELLAQHRPFDVKGKSYEEIIRNVCETEPPKPSETLGNHYLTVENEPEIAQIPKNQLRGDLDNIILKALRKEPSERYGSVQQFAEDISRFLNGLPVLARPQTRQYRFGKFVKRHKAGVLAAALILISLIGGISVATWQAIVARRERAKADLRFNDVRQLANSVIFDYQDRLKELAGSTEIQEKMISDAVAYLDRLSAESSQDLDLQMELAKAYVKIGDIQGNTGNLNRGQFDLAKESYLKALELYESAAQKNQSDSAVFNQLAENYKKLAGVERIEGNSGESVFYFEKSVETYRKSLEIKPDDTTSMQGLAWSQINIATLHEEPNQVDASLAMCREAVEIFEKLAAKEPDNEKLQNNLPNAYEALADILMAKPEKRGEALKIYETVLALFQEKQRQNPNDLELKQRIALEHSYIADALDSTDKAADATASYRKSLELYDEVVKIDAKNEYAVMERSYVKVMFGKFLVKQGKSSEAIEILQEPLKVLPARFEQNPQEFLSDFLAALAGQSIAKAKIMLFTSGKNKDLNEMKTAEKILQASIATYAKYTGKIVIPRMSARDLMAEANENLKFCKQKLND